MSPEEIRSANALAAKYEPNDLGTIAHIGLTPAERERLIASGAMGMREPAQRDKPEHDNRGKFRGKVLIAPAALALAVAEYRRGVSIKAIAPGLRVSYSSLLRAIRAYEQSPAREHAQGVPAQSP